MNNYSTLTCPMSQIKEVMEEEKEEERRRRKRKRKKRLQ